MADLKWTPCQCGFSEDDCCAPECHAFEGVDELDADEGGDASDDEVEARGMG